MLTDFAALTPLQKKLYSAKVWQAGRDQSFFMSENGFMSGGLSDSTKPIHYVNELTETERGARCVMPLVLDLVGDGVVDDNDLEGNEEALISDYLEIKVSQLRHGIKSRGKMSEQKTVIRFRATAKDKLAFWKAEKVDEILFLMASGVAYTKKLNGSTRSVTSEFPTLAFAGDVAAPSSGRVLYAGTATSTASLTTADKMTWTLLVKAHTMAIRKKLKPIKVSGTMSYVVVMSAEQARDLKNDNDYKTIVAQGSKRGPDNELFKGSFAMVDGLYLYQHNKVYTTLGATSGTAKWGSGSTIDGAQALLMGAQALGWARIGEPEWEESDNTDYKNKTGVSYGMMVGAIKAKFKSLEDLDSNGDPTSQDFSLISIYTAAAA